MILSKGFLEPGPMKREIKFIWTANIMNIINVVSLTCQMLCFDNYLNKTRVNNGFSSHPLTVDDFASY